MVKNSGAAGLAACLGAIIGAGFASGREVVAFFTRYGVHARWLFPLSAAALALLCYLPEGTWTFWAAAGLAVLGGAALLLPALGKNKRLRLTLVLIALSLAAGLLYGRGWRHFIADPVREKCGGSHLFSATVCDWPQETDTGWRVTVRLTDARGAKAVCYLSDEAADLKPGQMLLGEAYWQDASVIKGTEITTFTARGVFALLYCNTFPDVSPGSAGSVRYLPQHLARAMRDTVSRVWPDETAAAILRAELLGDRSGIDTALSSRFSEAGVSHLFAVSGLHCAFLLTLLSLLVGPQRQRLLAAVGIAVLTVYMFMVGLTPSVVRACIMQFFLLLAPWPTSTATAVRASLRNSPVRRVMHRTKVRTETPAAKAYFRPRSRLKMHRRNTAYTNTSHHTR